MRRPRLFGPFLLTLLLLSLLVIAGCGGAIAPGNVSGSPATTASDVTTPTAEIATTSSDAATTGTFKSAPASDATPGSGPDSGTTPTSSDGLPAAITPEEIKNAMWSIGMGSPDQLQIYDYENFGHYAAAYVMAADKNAYLVLFNDETGGWAILATYTGLGWEAVQADLRAKAAPEDLIDWANPGEG